MAKQQTAEKKPPAAAAPATAAASVPAVIPKNEVATLPMADMLADAGAGMEGTDRDSFAIPFLTILQKNSPQVDEDSGAAIPGAKAGMIFNTVTQQMYDGKSEGIILVPCAFRRTFLHWGPRGGQNKGFKGEVSIADATAMMANKTVVEHKGQLYYPGKEGELDKEVCDRLVDTRIHYVLHVLPDGVTQQAVLSLSSTQIKKSRMLMSALGNVRLPPPNHTKTPPTFANMLKATTVPEANDQGTWSGWRFELRGLVSDPEVYAAAKNFHAAIVGGQVNVKFDQAESDDPAATPEASDKF